MITLKRNFAIILYLTIYQYIKLKHLMQSSPHTLTGSNQVILQSVQAINGQLVNPAQNSSFSPVGNLQIQISKVNQISISYLQFSNLSNITNNLIYLVQSSFISISNCIFNSLQFGAVPKTNSIGYHIINIQQMNLLAAQSVVQSPTTVLIQNNKFNGNNFTSIGSLIYLNTILQTQTVLQSNSFSNNTHCQTSAIQALNMNSAQLYIQNNYFYNNTLYLNNGTVLYLNTISGAINFLNNFYQQNNAIKGNGGCLYVTNVQSQMYFKQETYLLNRAILGGSIFLYNLNSQIYFNQTLFANNSVLQDGAAINIQQFHGALTLILTNFTSNVAKNNGGSILIYYSSATISIQLCKYYNNRALANGGAFYLNLFNSTISFQNSTLLQNSALNAGAISILQSGYAVTFYYCFLYKNTAVSKGGAILIQSYSGVLSVIDSKFSQNNAPFGGAGAIYGSSVAATFLHCSVYNNQASTEGGAMYVYGSQGTFNLNFNNFSYNTAGQGGSLYFDTQQLIILIQNCNFFQNIANQNNGGAINFNVLGNSLTVQQNNFTANSGVNAGAIIIIGTAQNINIIFLQNYFINNSALQQAGAIAALSTNSQITFNNNTYINNQALLLGGAVFLQVTFSAVLFINETYQQNVAFQSGGAIYMIQGLQELSITNCLFSQNYAQNGAALYLQGQITQIFINSNTFIENFAKINGGAIFFINCGQNLTLQTNQFTRNTAYGQGGSVYLFIIQNIYILNGSYFYGNQAVASGGALALYQVQQQLVIKSSQFINNSALIGGALDIQQPQQNLSISDCQFLSNTAIQNGGAITLIAQKSSKVFINLTQSIFYQNIAKTSNGGDIYSQYISSMYLFMNSHSNSQSVSGGSVYLLNTAIVQLQNASFSNMLASEYGSAVYMYQGGNFSCTNSNFQYCGGNCGTVYIEQTKNIWLDSINIFSNTAQSYASGIFIDQSQNASISNILVMHNFAASDAGGLMLQDIAALQITNLNCTNNQASTGNGGCLNIINAQNIQLNGTFTFTSNLAGVRGGAIYIQNSLLGYLFMQNMNFQQNQAQQGGAIAIINQNNVTVCINNVNFIQNQAVDYGGAIYLSGVPSVQAIAYDINQFIVNPTSPNDQISALIITQCYFLGNQAVFGGGAVTILQNSIAFINNTQFVSNQQQITSITSEGGGGALFMSDVSSVWIANSLLINNTAYRGGAIYQTSTEIDSEIQKYVYLNSILFQSNNAKQEGGAINIGYNQKAIEISNCQFEQNSALIAGALIISLENVLQKSQQQRALQTQYQTCLNLTDNQFINNTATNQALYSQAIRIVVNQELSTTQSSQLQEFISSNNNFDLYEFGNAISIGCQAGEQHDPTINQCSVCSVGLYSVGGYDSKCVECPANSQCQGNYSLLKVDSGYWHQNASSLNIIYCQHTIKQCLGGELCAVGYTGMLCEECDYQNGYARGRLPFSCDICWNTQSFISLTIISVVFSAILVLLVVYSNVTYRDEELRNLLLQKIASYLIAIKDNTPALTRVLIGHTQVLTILFIIDIQYPKEFVNFFSYFGQFTQTTSNQLVCIFGSFNGIHHAYANIVYNHVEAFLVFLLLVIILAGMHFRKAVVFKQQFMAITLNLLIIILPGMINQLIAMLSKRTIAQLPNQAFTIYELGIVWGSKDFQPSYYLVLPLLFFWLSVFVWIVYIIFSYGKAFFQKNSKDQEVISQNKSNLTLNLKYQLSQKSIFTYNYGNIFIGYTKQRYFWEAVMMSARLALILVQNLFSYNPTIANSLSILVIVAVQALQLHKSPYSNITVKKYSEWCLFIQILSILSLQIMYSQSDNPVIFYCSFALILIFNYMLALFLVRKLLIETFKIFQFNINSYLQRNGQSSTDERKYFLCMDKCLKNTLKKAARRKQKANYGWNVVLHSVRLMTQKIRQINQSELQQMIDFGQQSQFEKEYQISKDQLLREVYEDWKQKDTNSLNMKFYIRWNEMRGLKLDNNRLIQLQSKNKKVSLVLIQKPRQNDDQEERQVQQQISMISNTMDMQQSALDSRREMLPTNHIRKKPLSPKLLRQIDLDDPKSPVDIPLEFLDSRQKLRERRLSTATFNPQRDSIGVEAPYITTYRNLFSERAIVRQPCTNIMIEKQI